MQNRWILKQMVCTLPLRFKGLIRIVVLHVMTSHCLLGGCRRFGWTYLHFLPRTVSMLLRNVYRLNPEDLWTLTLAQTLSYHHFAMIGDFFLHHDMPRPQCVHHSLILKMNILSVQWKVVMSGIERSGATARKVMF